MWTKESERRFSVENESEFKVGGATVGASFGLSSAEIYGVTVGQHTIYEGEVGDIEELGQWSKWRYDFGPLVYRYGADQNGKPERGKRPFQVIDYWVDALGAGYSP